jgi:ATP-dependent RNA helicase RhlE
MLFKKLGLSDLIVKAVKDQGYIEPSPIQVKVIPVILAGKDVLAGAQTGTGKTAGFTLPMLELLQKKPLKKDSFRVRALVLTPTRELASQVEESIKNYGKYLNLTSAVIFGGVGIGPQKAELKKGVDILVATPGRLLDLADQKSVDLSRIEFLVLDEADRMLDMGFIHDVKKVLALLPKQKQSLLFSATFSAKIKDLADGILNQPVLVEVATRNSSAQTINQAIHFVDKSRKRELLSYLIKRGDWHQVLVFTRTKHGANKLTKQLQDDGITASAIHGNKSQTARTKALKDFKDGLINVLVATDIAARGIDIDQLPHVVNFEIPNVSEDYVHRIGRTGRAGNVGEAISLVCVDELDFLKDIEKLIKKEIPKIEISGFKVDPSIKAEPIKMGGNRSQNSRRNTPPSNRSSSNRDRERRNYR